MHNIETRKGEYRRQLSKEEAESQKENPHETAEKFREKLARMKAEEMAKKSRGEKYDPHFETINPEDWSDEEAVGDAAVLEKILTKTLKFEEFNAARNEENMSRPADGESHMEDSRPSFYQWLINKVATKEWRQRWGLKKSGR